MYILVMTFTFRETGHRDERGNVQRKYTVVYCHGSRRPIPTRTRPRLDRYINYSVCPCNILRRAHHNFVHNILLYRSCVIPHHRKYLYVCTKQKMEKINKTSQDSPPWNIQSSIIHFITVDSRRERHRRVLLLLGALLDLWTIVSRLASRCMLAAVRTGRL